MLSIILLYFIQSRHDPNYSQTITPDQNFPSPGSAGSPRNSFPMSAAYMANEMFVHGREQTFPGRNVTSGNFNAPEFYQQDALRVANVSYSNKLMLHEKSL